MASRKMTFTLPQDLAVEFLQRVPSSGRSQFVASALAAKLREHDEQLVRACELANHSADVAEIESAFDALCDPVDQIQEPW